MTGNEHEADRWLAECTANMYKELDMSALEIVAALHRTGARYLELAMQQDSRLDLDK